MKIPPTKKHQMVCNELNFMVSTDNVILLITLSPKLEIVLKYDRILSIVKFVYCESYFNLIIIGPNGLSTLSFLSTALVDITHFVDLVEFYFNSFISNTQNSLKFK